MYRRAGRPAAMPIDQTARPARRLLAGVIALFAGLFVAVTGAQAQNHSSYGQAVVVIIANTDYSQTDDVAYAARDADAFEVFARDVLHARVFRYDNMGTNQMGEFFGVEGRPGSLTNHILAPNTDLYIYYAGHGTHDAPANGEKARNYIMPVDANPDQRFLARQAYALDDLKRSLNTLQNGLLSQGRITLVLESCFSGLSPSADGGASKGLVQGVSAPPLGRAQDIDTQDIRLWAATSPDTDYAVWDTEFQRGVFTDSLLSGLHGGRADANGDYQVTAAEMQNFVTSAINRRVAALGQGGASFQQRPIFVGMESDDVVVTYQGATYPSYSTDKERAYVERFLGEELIQTAAEAKDSGDLAAMGNAADGLRNYLTQCSFCDERTEINRELASLNDVLSACNVEGRFLDRILADKNMSRLTRFLDRLECEQMRSATQACLTSADFSSEACGCLADEACRTKPQVQVSPCQQEWDGVKTAAVGAKNTRALADFLRKKASQCAVEIRDAKKTLGKLCEDLANDARLGQANADRATLERFVSQHSDCATQVTLAKSQIQSLRQQEASSVCQTSFDDARSSALSRQKPAVLSDYIRSNRQTCTAEAKLAQQTLDKLCDDLARTAGVGRSDANAATLERFISRHGACRSQVALARTQVRSMREQAEGQVCRDRYDLVNGSDSEADYTDFIRSNPSCSAQVAEAYRQIDLLVSRNRQCQTAFSQAESESNSQALARFMQNYSHCSEQIPEAARLMLYWQQQESQPVNPYPYDGVYIGRRGYTDSSRPSKSKWCLSRYNFTMTVQNHRVSFDSDGRYWQGYVNDNGYLTIEHNGISPAPKHNTWIRGSLSNAEQYNGYCGYGYFTVQRQ